MRKVFWFSASLITDVGLCEKLKRLLDITERLLDIIESLLDVIERSAKPTVMLIQLFIKFFI